MSVKTQIDQYLITRLATIRAGNNVDLFGQQYAYQTDAGQQVTQDMEFMSFPDDGPLLNLFRGDLSSGYDSEPQPSRGEENHYYDLKIDGVIPDTLDGAEGEKLRQDIVSLLRSDEYFGGLVQSLGTLTSKVKVMPGNTVKSYVEVSFNAFYVTLWGQS